MPCNTAPLLESNVPIPSAIPFRSRSERYRLSVIKAGALLGLGFVLFFAGLHGKHQANLQVRLGELILSCNQLQQALDDLQTPTLSLVGALRSANPAVNWPFAPGEHVQKLAGLLQLQLGQFDSGFRPGELSDAESLDLRLAKSTLANAEQRFMDALAMITEEDEKGKPVDRDVHISRRAAVLHIRGDSFFGLRRWQDASGRYREILTLQPNSTGAIARLSLLLCPGQNG